MIASLKSAIRHNNLQEFKTLVGQMGVIPWEIENELIVGKRQDYLKILIEVEKLSDFSKAHLLNLMDADNELLIKLKED